MLFKRLQNIHDFLVNNYNALMIILKIYKTHTHLRVVVTFGSCVGIILPPAKINGIVSKGAGIT